MKIVFLQDDFPPHSEGGAGFSTYELARGMKDAGHEVSVITTVRDVAATGTTLCDGIAVYALKSSYPLRLRAWVSLYNPQTIPRIKEILKEIRPDVVHINNVHVHLSYYAFKLANKYGRRVIFTARDTMSFTYGKLDTERYRDTLDASINWRDNLHQARKAYNPFRNILIKKFLKYAHVTVAVSHALQQAFLVNGIPNVTVVHTGMGDIDWTATDTEIECFKNKSGISGRPIIFYGARISEGKGGGRILEALVKIVKEVPLATLVIAGKVDGYGESLKKQAMKSGLVQNLVFLGWVGREEMRIAYASADVVVVPSTYLDPFPRAVIESMASKRTVIGTRYGGAPEIVVDGVTGYIVNPFDTNELAERTITILRDNVLKTCFGNSGHERIRQEFTIERMVRDYLVLYELKKFKKP